MNAKIVSRKYWHQCLRWTFTSASTFLTRRVPSLPKPSLLERYTYILLVFTNSGLMHVVTCIASTEVSRLGRMIFFQSFAPLIMVEDAAQEIWRRWTREPPKKDGKVAL